MMDFEIDKMDLLYKRVVSIYDFMIGNRLPMDWILRFNIAHGWPP